MFIFISKIFSIILALVVISKSYVDFRARRESLQMFLVWSFTWIAIVFVALVPSFVAYMLVQGGGQAGIGTFIGMAVVFLFFLFYRMYVKLEQLEQKITTLVQTISLSEHYKSRAK